MARKRVDAGVPVCPDHPDGWVVRNGLYGSGVRRRQRWRCELPDGSRHNFAGNVVRTVLPEPTTCEVCEQHLETFQGPGVAHRYRFPVTEVATALVRVGRGMSYSEAAQRARVRTSRGKTTTAQLVGNWVEVFGPVVTGEQQEERWPETVVVDSKPLHANRPGGGSGTAFTLLAAWGYEAGEDKGRLVALRAVGGNVNAVKWGAFFASLQGQPRLLITDHDQPTIKAVRKGFPAAALRLCRWHLKRQLTLMLRPIVSGRTDPLAVVAEQATDDLVGWDAFKAAAASRSLPVLDRWVQQRDALLLAEFAAGQLPDHWGNGAVEQSILRISTHMAPRAFCFRNATRTNRLLELVRLHENRTDDAGRYAAAIRRHVENATNGNLGPQLAITDPYGSPSLR